MTNPGLIGVTGGCEGKVRESQYHRLCTSPPPVAGMGLQRNARRRCQAQIHRLTIGYELQSTFIALPSHLFCVIADAQEGQEADEGQGSQLWSQFTAQRLQTSPDAGLRGAEREIQYRRNLFMRQVFKKG